MSELNAAIVIAVLSAVPVGAQNLLVNPGFDVANQLDGWTCTATSGTATWSPDDRSGVPTSGAMQHDVSAGTVNQLVSCHQCVPIAELNAYVASMWHFWPSDGDVTQDGSSRISIVFYSDPGCTTLVDFGTIAVTNYPPHPLDTWILLATDEVVAPTGAFYGRLTVVTWQDLANEPDRARIDDVDFRTTTLFRDGFESGGVGMWSSWVP